MRTLPLIAALLAGFSSLPGRAATLADAQAAYGLFDVNRAESLYREVAKSAGTAADRAVAERELARIAWLVDGNRKSAISLLEASLPRDPDPCPAALLYGRVLNDSFGPALARNRIKKWTKACLDMEPGVALEEIRTFAIESRHRRGSRARLSALEGLKRWSALPEQTKASSEGAILQLTLAIQARDPEQALDAWQSYFWLDQDSLALPALGLSDEAIRARFRAGLSQRPEPANARALAWLLMRAGFYQALKDFTATQPVDVRAHEGWSTIATYLAFRDTLGKAILSHDRAYARGAKDEDAYERRLSEILRNTASALAPKTSDPRAVLRDRFGVWGTEPGKSNGVSGIHLGHVISDERKRISQDGREGQIRLIVLDNMIHNSFSAWLMDGESAPGGWAVDGSTIVQVRPRYLALIDDFANLAVPGPALDRARAEIDRQQAEDQRIARKDPIAFLPAVKARLRLKAIQSLSNEVRSSTRSQSEFQREFRKSYWAALIGSSIIAHEGRHVLDQVTFQGGCALSDDELEYRAKLSEIRFAPLPRLAVSSIFSPLFGGSSGHGKANRRLFNEYARWIEANGGEIKGYDPSLTPLEQLDRLNDTQLVKVAASLEPTTKDCDNPL